ncbi:tat pathway signal sequence protein [Rutstroemia sp. NJR-2017a BBW]|nr:tat pathway signal sequence protein [Rutstroemia sp. NJR-2017a BBW]
MARKGLICYRTSSIANGRLQQAPVLKTTNLRYSTTAFNGSFMQETIYRRPGSPEVDLAWEALGIECRKDRASVIPEEDGHASGLTKHNVHRAKKYGGGYFVNVEGLHHLHCLNIVRKSLYYNYEYYKAIGDYVFDNREDISKFHFYAKPPFIITIINKVSLPAHCLDIVRQVLMCNVDTGVLGQVWTRQSETMSPQAFPDFNTRHKCKDYEAVRMWAEENQVPSDEKLSVGYVALPEEGDVLPFIP